MAKSHGSRAATIYRGYTLRRTRGSGAAPPLWIIYKNNRRVDSALKLVNAKRMINFWMDADGTR